MSDLLFHIPTNRRSYRVEMYGTQIAVNQPAGTINLAADWHLGT
jgi:hypothetical protein